jgi:hypothetical protein
MERHGSESYFVIGEGLLSDASSNGGGPVARAATATPPFRFSRMGPKGGGKQLGEAALKKLGRAMAAGGGGQTRVPAGFTYLGQFVDHDLTFDKTTVMLGTAINPTALLQGRSPSLDLDSLYGAGPQDPESARFYEADLVHLRHGKTAAVGGDAAMDGFDLPRRATTRTSSSPRPTWRSSASTTGSSTACPRRCRPPSASRRRGSWSPSTTSGCCATTSCRASAARRR